MSLVLTAAKTRYPATSGSDPKRTARALST